MTADMSFAAGHANVQARFHYSAFFGLLVAGRRRRDRSRSPAPVLPGGLVVGNVSDANTGLGLNGATVTALADGSSTTTVAAPEQGDGFYSLFAAGSGSQDFEAAAELHTSLTKSATITPDAVVRLDFALAAGLLDASPRPLSAIVSPGGTQIRDARRHEQRHRRRELRPPRGRRPAGRGRAEPFFASIEDRREDRKLFRSRLVRRHGRDAPALGASEASRRACRSRPARATSSALSRSISRAPTAWPTTRALGPSLDLELLVRRSRSASSATVSTTSTSRTARRPARRSTSASIWLGDGTYNARTGMIWQPNVAYRRRPRASASSRSIRSPRSSRASRSAVPGATSRRLVGLAYDYATDTYYVGDAARRHHARRRRRTTFSTRARSDSRSRDSPTTRPRGTCTSATFSSGPFDVYVVDPHNGYLVLSGFEVTSGGVPVLNGGGVSLEADCFGHLWIYDVFDDDGLRGRVGGARLVRQRHPVALGGPDVGHDSRARAAARARPAAATRCPSR